MFMDAGKRSINDGHWQVTFATHHPLAYFLVFGEGGNQLEYDPCR